MSARQGNFQLLTNLIADFYKKNVTQKINVSILWLQFVGQTNNVNSGAMFFTNIIF